MYSIKVRYTTGDSLGSNETDCMVGHFTTVEKAQEACIVILAHNKFFDKVESWNYPEHQKVSDLKKAKKESWYVEDHYSRGPSEFSVKFEGQKFHASWRGYFETLLSLEVVLDSSGVSPMVFYPD